MPDTTPQRLKQIRAAADYWRACPGTDLATVVTDLLAMIDALEAQIRDLTKPEEDVEIDLGLSPDGRCPICGGVSLEITATSDGVRAAQCCHRCSRKLMPEDHQP